MKSVITKLTTTISYSSSKLRGIEKITEQCKVTAFLEPNVPFPYIYLCKTVFHEKSVSSHQNKSKVLLHISRKIITRVLAHEYIF